jgi:alpha-tubulin suppressor-like RCC1 family protein
MRVSSSAPVAALALGCLFGCSTAPDSESTTIAAVSIGDTQTCTISERGEVACDGRAIGINDAIAISVGHDHACVVRQGGRVACFGDDTHGQLGDGTSELSNIVGVVAGLHRTCAWNEQGEVLCWGAREYDPHAMIGEPRDLATPTRVEGLSHVKSVSLGGFHGCALIDDGTVRCFGANYFGQLGNGTELPSEAPVTADLSGVTAIATGIHHTCAIAGESVYCWGADMLGQLGEASNGMHLTTPTLVPSILRADSIAAGGDHTCVKLKGRSAPRCWGYNDVGQVSPGRPYIVRPPTIPTGVDDVSSVASGALRSCAIKTDGSLYCWGEIGPT